MSKHIFMFVDWHENDNKEPIGLSGIALLLQSYA